MDSKASRPFEIHKMSFLQDPKCAAQYLEESYLEGEELFQLALRDVAKAQEGGVKGIAKAAGLNRENLYKALSKTGNPKRNTISKILNALGMEMRVSIVLKNNAHI